MPETTTTVLVVEDEESFIDALTVADQAEKLAAIEETP